MITKIYRVKGTFVIGDSYHKFTKEYKATNVADLEEKIYERFGSNWNKCTTHYSSNDKTFLCRLWGKYHKGHEKDVVMSMYQMKFDELLPEVLPVLAEVVEELLKQ